MFLYYFMRPDAKCPGPATLEPNVFRTSVRYSNRIGKWRGIWGYVLYSELIPVEDAHKLGLSRGRPYLWETGRIRFRELALSVREEEIARLQPD